MANRRRLHDDLDSAWRSGRAVDVVVADADRSEALNDACGHAFGDRVLRQIADALGSAALGRHLVARTGGDELAVLP